MFQESLEHVIEVHREIETLVDSMESRDNVSWVIKDKINKCRERLSKLDAILADNDAILEGYYNAKQHEEDKDVASEG
jgi:hypothetical protein